ncbi:hypothetical protein [Dyadobacter sp. BHUBP1]|uniref:hypothetical protein n=1 Tax=Dyadobacter sp. BHUBP1 TaxID=3424178 RepID=UPI003D325EC7
MKKLKTLDVLLLANYKVKVARQRAAESEFITFSTRSNITFQQFISDDQPFTCWIEPVTDAVFYIHPYQSDEDQTIVLVKDKHGLSLYYSEAGMSMLAWENLQEIEAAKQTLQRAGFLLPVWQRDDIVWQANKMSEKRKACGLAPYKITKTGIDQVMTSLVEHHEPETGINWFTIKTAIATILSTK